MNTILEQINSAGFIFVRFALPMLVQSSVLIGVLLLADLLLRKKVRAVVRYWLWMLVLIKLALPTTLSSPVSLGYWFGDKLAGIKVSDTSIIAQPVNLPQIIETETSAATGTPYPDIRPTTISPSITKPVVAQTSPAPLTWQGIVFLVWMAVVGTMCLLLLQRLIFVTGLVAQAQNPAQLMNDAFRFCCGQIGIKGKVGLKVSANTACPAVCGLFRPVILVPQNLAPTLGSSRLRMVFLHELTHIKRGDLWVNLVQTILQIVYFYNPLLWLANSIIRRIREQAVDEAVQVAMGANAPQYPQTLVDVAKIAFNRPVLSLRLIGIVESKNVLKGRIERMLNRPIPKSAKLGFLGLIALLIFAVIFLPMAKAKSKPPEFIIKGTVTDAETGRLITGAKVGDDQYAQGKQWTTTDANGFYFYNTWYEEHNIKCEAPGYKTQNKLLYTRLFGSEKEKVIDFVLEPSNGTQNIVEGKKQQTADINAKKKEIAVKLEVLYNQRDRLQRELDVAERALGEVRDRWNISDLEEHNYPHPIVERLNRLQKEQDDCALEISQLKARADNLKKEAQTEQEKKELKDTENHLVELQAKFDTLEKMRTDAAAQKRDFDLARIQYNQRASIRDERLQRLNEIKAQIEKFRLMYENPAVFDVEMKVEEKSKVDDKDKMDSENLAAEGWELWRQRKLPEAEEAFKKAVSKDPTNANAWNGLGWAQQNQGKPLNAKASFEKCLEIQPKHAAALNGLGWIAKAQGKTDEAIAHWEKAIEAAPNATAALNGLATTYMELKQFDKAAKYYKMWLKVEPDNTDAKAGLERAKSQKTDVQVNTEDAGKITDKGEKPK
jgi:beta-lactamase regulating signal transducer with metallopeptidase domain/tetratricopeptide (TPR) repeat protein